MKESEFQIELNELRARSKQQIMLNAEPVMITPPALFTNEMLEQIRAVVRKEVREEVRAALNENESERLMEEEEISRKTIFPDARVVQYSPFEPGVFAELEHQGKLYKGVLNFVKDIE